MSAHNRITLTPGQKYGRLSLIRNLEQVNANNEGLSLVQCECGNRCIRSSSRINRGKINSCGCGKFQGSDSVDIEVGTRFGELTTTTKSYTYEHRSWFDCKCKCGKAVSVRWSALRTGNTKSCGCVKSEHINPVIEGEKYGQVTVIANLSDRDDKGYLLSLCMCDCGAEKNLRTFFIATRKVKSCGCSKRRLAKALAEKRAVNLNPGEKYHQLLVVRFVEKQPGLGAIYECVCDCGNVCNVRASKLKSGEKKRCGRSCSVKNKKPTTNKSEWTLGACRVNAFLYNTPSEWQKYSSAYQVAYRRSGWLALCTKHMVKQTRWTLGACKANAFLYNTAYEWQKNSPAYKAAYRKSEWFRQCTKHMDMKMEWTLGECKVSAFLYNSPYEWQKNSPAYKAAYRKPEWFKKCTRHMKRIARWTLGECKANAFLYNSRFEWQQQSGAYKAAYRKPMWFEQCTAHMDERYAVVEVEHCMSDAARYGSYGEWKDNSPVMFMVAEQNSWVGVCCYYQSQVNKQANLIDPLVCIYDARRFKSKQEWNKNKPSTYKRALKEKWMPICENEMRSYRKQSKKIVTTSLSYCKIVALRFASPDRWMQKEPLSYGIALENNWVKECCEHMLNI